jgi:outer membrane protein assembly factor BamB
MTTSIPRRQARRVRRTGRARGRIVLALVVAGIAFAAGSALLAAAETPVPSISATGALASQELGGLAAIGHDVGSPLPSAPWLASAGAVSVVSGTPSSSAGPFPHGLLIADRGNARIIAVDNAGRIFWRFPVRGSLPPGVRFAADDAFVSPDGKTIVANDEYNQVIYRIDIQTRKVIWSYGHSGVPGRASGYLHNPDDAYPLANGDIVVADILNCRVIEIAPDKHIVRTFGRAGICSDNAPTTYGDPNGDTPLPDGGLLITEITGSRVVRLSASGRVLFDIHVPVAYPSDAQLNNRGDVIVVDYSNPGAVIAITSAGHLLWRYAPTAGRGRMDHPSLGTPLPNGDIVINDDARDRMIVLDPKTMRIVWQYGHTDVAGTAPGYLSDPDGHQPIPANAVF